MNARLPITRLLVLASAFAAFLFQLWLEARAWAGLEWLSPAYAAAAFLIARWRPGVAVAAILSLGPLSPALTDAFAGFRAPGSNPLWLSAQAGFVAAFVRGDWSLPAWWRAPLVYAALAIAFSWPIVAGREFGFDVSRLYDSRLITTSQGIAPAVHAQWIADVAAVALLGLLWVDLLMRMSRAAPSPSRWLQRFGAAPFAAGASLAALVGLYQMAVDIEFLNLTFFGALGRPTGTMIDGNAFGAMCAIAAAMAMTAAFLASGAVARASWLAAAVLCWGGAWSSASRTAFLIAAITAVSAGAAAFLAAPSRRRRHIAAAFAIGLAMAIAALAFIPAARERGPVARLFDSISTQAWQRSVSTIASDLVTRDGYGTIGHGMIGDWPLAGVGIGSYHGLAIDFGRLYGVQQVRPDNAQNWLRHQLAELGILGGLGWIIWIAALGRTMWRAVKGPQRHAACVLAGGLIGVAAASLFGVPTMNAIVLSGFWTMTAWIGTMAELPAAGGPRLAARIGAGVLLTAFVAVTAWSAIGKLSVPYRAALAGWEYDRGWYDYDDSSTPRFRWTRKEAVSSFLPKGKFLRLQISVLHPDLAVRPVDVKVRLFRQTILRARLGAPETIVRYIPAPESSAGMMLSFEVSRTFRAAPPDNRDLGIAVAEWSFVNTVPPDGWIVH